MSTKPGRRSPSLVISCLALLVALSGSALALSRGEVRSKHIAKNAIKAKHIAKNAVKTAKLADGAVTEAKLADGVGGLQGDPGSKGDPGVKGEPGVKGDPGSKGDPGVKGDQGDSAWSADCNEGLPVGDVMVRAGAVCIDKYEASVWDSPTGGTQLTSEPEIDDACPNNGQPAGAPTNCVNFYARSVQGVTPARLITYFQAQQALANSAKRLPSNAEWQMAVSGTPDTGGVDNGTTDCNTEATFALADTGSRAGCVSRFGAFDMVGNVSEWVGDWDETADGCANFAAGEFGGDRTCFGDGTPSRFPSALYRGGGFGSGPDAGPFAIDAFSQPSLSNVAVGFRGAR